MRLPLRFFAQWPNFDLLIENNEMFDIDYPQSWCFFFMRSRQTFLFTQNGIHLATKIRNRLLSGTTTMFIGNQYVNLNYLADLINNYSKIDRNLVKSDVFPRDRQSFSSCLKLSSDNVLNLLEESNHVATYVYLYLLKLIIHTYVSKDTNIYDRLYLGWILTFICRFWW